MKIGIITFWTTKDNYGQILQSFALQQYLRNHGHEPFLIRYQDTVKEGASFKWYRIFTYLLKLPIYVSWFVKQKLMQRKAARYQQSVAKVDRHFPDFMNAYIKHTEEVYTEETIRQNPPLTDAYICGSDQVWAGDWAYYLDFAPENKPKIAYAPSLGGLTSFAPEYEAHMKSLLNRFSFIGMREQSGVEVCHRLGRKDAVKVVDPTLLLTREDYDKIRIPTKYGKPYLLMYILGNPMACKVEEIFEYAKSRGLEVKYVTSGHADNHKHIYAQVGEWLDLIANAKMVVTNSFHGTVFSLIYHTPFITIPLNNGYERMNTRVEELLKEGGLTSQLYAGKLGQCDTNPDFSKFDAYRKIQEGFSHDCIAPFIPDNR